MRAGSFFGGGAFPVAEQTPAGHEDLREIRVLEGAGGGQANRSHELIEHHFPSQFDERDVVLVLLIPNIFRMDVDYSGGKKG